MTMVILALLVCAIASPMLLSMTLTRVKTVIYTGPATVQAFAFRRNRQGLYPVRLVVPDLAPFNFEVSQSRFNQVLDGQNTAMVSVARRFVDRKVVLNQILWKYEVNQAAAAGRYDRISPDRPVDQDLGIVPGLLYFALSMGSVYLFVGDNLVASLMRSDPLFMHAFWYGNLACVTLCGYWLARKQPAISGYLSEGGSRLLLGVLYSIIGGIAALAAVMFYEEPSPLMILGAICASAVGMLLAIVTGAFRSHPSAASPIVGLDHLALFGDSNRGTDALRLIAPPDLGRDKKILP